MDMCQQLLIYHIEILFVICADWFAGSFVDFIICIGNPVAAVHIHDCKATKLFHRVIPPVL